MARCSSPCPARRRWDCLAFGPDDASLLAANGDRAHLWILADSQEPHDVARKALPAGRQVGSRRWAAQPFSRAAYSRDGTCAAVAAEDGRVRVWQLRPDSRKMLAVRRKIDISARPARPGTRPAARPGRHADRHAERRWHHGAVERTDRRTAGRPVAARSGQPACAQRRRPVAGHCARRTRRSASGMRSAAARSVNWPTTSRLRPSFSHLTAPGSSRSRPLPPRRQTKYTLGGLAPGVRAQSTRSRLARSGATARPSSTHRGAGWRIRTSGWSTCGISPGPPTSAPSTRISMIRPSCSTTGAWTRSSLCRLPCSAFRSLPPGRSH